MLAAGAGGAGSAAETAAVAELCSTYWFPLYSFVRRQGHDPASAEDLTQGFFTTLLERQSWRTADRTKGRFRSFLLGALKHYLADEYDRQQAQRRGAGQRALSLDAKAAEAWHLADEERERNPERAFEYQWALLLLDRVLAALRSEYEEAGRARQFEFLQPMIRGDGAAEASYAAIGQELATSEGAVKVAVHRLRARYREMLRAEIGRTVGEPGAVDEEIRYLLSCVRGGRVGG